MPIDFAKYGGKDPSPKSKDSGIKLDFSKYQEPDQPSFVDKMQSGALPNMDIRQSPLMKQVQQSDQQQSAEQPQADNRNGVEKTLDYIFKENPVSRALNYIPAKIAQYAVPDAPMINQNGIIPGTNARQQFANENPVLSSGNSAFDKIGDVAGQFIGPMVGTMGTGAGALTSGAENVLAKYGAKFGDSLGGKVAKSAAEGALVGAPLNAAATLSTSDPTLSQVGESAALGGGLGAGLGALGKYAGTKIGQALENWRANRNPQAEQQVSELLALPPGRGEQRMSAAMDRSNLSPNESPIAGQGGLAEPLALPSSSRYDAAQQIRSEIPLALPESQRYNRLQEAQQPLPYGSNPIVGQGSISDPLALPKGDYIPPTRYKVLNGEESFNRVAEKVFPAATERMTPPLENPNELAKWVQGHLNDAGHDVSLNDVRQLSYEDMRQLAEEMRGKLNPADVVRKTAHDMGYGKIYDQTAPTIKDRMAKDLQNQVYGMYPTKVSISKPKFNSQVMANAEAPRIRTYAPNKAQKPILEQDPTSSPAYKMQRAKQQLEQTSKLQKAKQLEQPIIGRASNPTEKVGLRSSPQQEIISASPKRNFAPADFIPSRPLNRNVSTKEPLLNKSELKFGQTVKSSDHTAPELKQRLEDQPLTGKRTSDVINQTKAAEYIKQHGQEGAANKIIAKQGKLQPHEVTAAQILAKQYSSMGGAANLEKALDIISKTATEGRQMGQAIQALSQWNKLDSEGALLQATRSTGRTLTPEEGRPIVAAAERVHQVAATKSLSDEVMHIVTNKAPGEALTEAEKAKIQEFQAQVKKVNEGLKPFLPKEKIAKVGKSNATIKEVSQIEPKARTRDQVVSFLDAKAEQARQRLAASRNIGFAAVNKGNPIADYAIIGASHIANGVVKLSDFTEQMVKDFGESVKPHINEVFNKATNIFRKENGLPTVQELDRAVNGAVKKGAFTEDEAHQFKAWAAEIGHMSDEFKLEATQDLQKAMNEIGISTFGQKASTVQTSMQLLSVPTAERNVIGNEAFNILQKINKIAAVPIDTAISKLTGDRTIVFKTGNQESYWKNFVQGAKSGWKGVSPNGQFASLDIHPEAFKSSLNPFKYLQKATGALLQSFDHAAYMRAYGETLGTYAKLTGKEISELDQTIHELADHTGQYATFQDDTFLSKIATGAKRLLNKPTDMLADTLVNKGMLPEKLSWKGIGTGDLVLKYAKTPANIIMRGIDFSPIGLMRGLGELAPLVFKREAFNQQKAVMALSRGITGTIGLTGLGYALASTGVLTGPSSSDADIRSLDTMTGKGEYKVNWSALERYVTGGLDKNAAQWQKGDRIFDWGWLQPMAISIAMGVNAQQSVAKQKADGTKSYVGVAKDALVGSLKTIMQQPLLQGVQNLVTGATNVAKYGSWTGIANIFKGAPASFVPALSNQARNFSDNTSRNTYDPNAWKEALNMVINRIPGLDKQLPVAYDTLGNAKEQIQDGQSGTLSQGLKSFASPIKMTTYTVSPEAKMIIDLINSSGDTKAAPRSPNKYLMVDKKKVELTPDQYSQIQQQTGLETQKQLAHLSPMLANPNIKDENKVKEVMSVLDKVGQKVRNDLNKQYPEFRPVKATH